MQIFECKMIFPAIAEKNFYEKVQKNYIDWDKILEILNFS